ncbi:MAG: MBL fold metallo-hydrolase [Pseudomonadota bacterium]|nr:MBL fold metallo-hydrolase [Pseudomonadota bacterium]
MGSADIPFRKEMQFEYGASQEVAPGVRRVVAENPSAFTHVGTNTYIVGRGEVAVIDPGPMLQQHVDNIKDAVKGERVTHIVVTHTHMDHSPASEWLKKLVDAPVVGAYPDPLESGQTVEAHQEDFAPDQEIVDGDTISGPGWTLEAVHTPGHMSNHHCFSLKEQKLLFSGDHVMGWNTTIVSPPDGNMREYLNSLRVCLGRDDDLYLPGHGPEIKNTKPFVRAYLNHRLMRERQIAKLLGEGVDTIPELVGRMYTHLPGKMHGAAARSVLAHMEHMVETGRATCDGNVAADSIFGARP